MNPILVSPVFRLTNVYLYLIHIILVLYLNHALPESHLHHLYHSETKETKTASSLVLLSDTFHHVSRGCEDLDGGALGDFLLSRQLLDGQYDLLRVFDSHLHCMAEVLLQHVLS